MTLSEFYQGLLGAGLAFFCFGVGLKYSAADGLMLFGALLAIWRLTRLFEKDNVKGG
jgi:hypothetical protein